MGYHSKPNTFIGHVKIKVEKLERSLSFYRDMLGFRILDQTTSEVKLTTDGKTSILSLVQPEDVIPKQGRTTGLYHFAILLPKRSDLANIAVHLTEKGIRFGASDHLVSEALYLHDPDGNEIEIYIDRDPEEWSWNDEEVAMAVDPLNFEDLFTYVTPTKWIAMPENTVMGHIHLHVSGLEKTEEFYVKGLGFDVVNRYGLQALFLSTGGYHHHIGVNTWNGVGAPTPPSNGVGLEYFTLVLGSAAERLKVVENVKQLGITVEEIDDTFITYDPSGIQIILAI